MEIYNRFFEGENSLSDLKDNSIVDKLVNFIKDNPFPKDKDLHNFADSLNIDHDLLEQYSYAILTVLLTGGYSKGNEVKSDKKELDRGIQIEYEHTLLPDINNKVVSYIEKIISTKIANDHLVEFDTYYTALDKMEKELEGK